MTLVPTRAAARGKWKGILIELGVCERFLRNEHGPCPLCGGKDRFRWDNKDGRGTYFCNNCGAGDGMTFAQKVLGLPFPDAARRVDALISNVQPDAVSRCTVSISDRERRDKLSELYLKSAPIRPGDLVDNYLESRGLLLAHYPSALRFARSISDGEGSFHPALLAMIGLVGAPKYSSIHRTFLMSDGSGKALIKHPRKIMPGRLPDGACVPLSTYRPGTPLGIAEGIETALAAAVMFDIPVWAALNTSLLKKWRPPTGCPEVHIYADNDPNFAGQNAAYELAARLTDSGIKVHIRVPDKPGIDWADEWLQFPTRKPNERICLP